MATKVSDNLLVSKASGSSRKYCLTMSATSYACWPSKLIFGGLSSADIFNLWMRDRTPGLRKIPTWSKAFDRSQFSASRMYSGNTKPLCLAFVNRGTPNTLLSANKPRSQIRANILSRKKNVYVYEKMSYLGV